MKISLYSVDVLSSSIIQQVVSKNSYVPMSFKMLSQLKFDDYIHYHGSKVDFVIVVAEVKAITYVTSKKGQFQLLITLIDLAGYGELQGIMTAYETDKLVDNILKQNNITTLSELTRVKCVINIRLQNDEFVYDIRNLEFIRDYNLVTHHIVSAIQFHCQSLYNN